MNKNKRIQHLSLTRETTIKFLLIASKQSNQNILSVVNNFKKLCKNS